VKVGIGIGVVPPDRVFCPWVWLLELRLLERVFRSRLRACRR
jgi:hypothetical protein